MTELKFGGNDVKRLMYKDKDVSGSKMLESGTILLLLSKYSDWSNRRFGVDFYGLYSSDPITCKVFGVEKDWKNVSQILVEVSTPGGGASHSVFDISELKNGPCNVDSNVTAKLEGKKITFTNKAKFAYTSILVEAYNE